ncbi:aminopeptidase P family protein [bacterium]|nr:aminopeptidase P family protein [bacterium]
MHPEFEKVSQTFEPAKLDDARRLSWESLLAIARQIRPGMLETQARALAEETLRAKGAERFWHKTHVRFGVNTRRTFSEMSLPGVRLQDKDIFFLDLGPVFHGYEGDVGAAFTVGEDPDMVRCAADARHLFQQIQVRWAEQGWSGKRLYDFAQTAARDMGWEFALDGASGHRIADFPHVLYHKGNLVSFAGTPISDRWILEVHLRHPKRMFGAFYEDTLTRQPNPWLG